MLITSYYYFYGAGKLAVVEGITVYLFDMNDIPTLLTMSAFAWRVIFFLFLFWEWSLLGDERRCYEKIKMGEKE